MVVVRAIYKNGQFQPLESVDLEEGQEVQLQIVNTANIIDSLLNDMLVSPASSGDDIDEDHLMQEIDEALKGKRPLSDIIIEERREGR